MILLVIFSLSVLILVHEFGHFVVAKFSGARVEEFGLGFPPRLFGKQIGETLYSINLLPFGGFVKIYGEDGSSEPKGRAPSALQTFADLPMWKRSAVMLAGVFMNVVLAWFLFSLVFAIGSPEHLMIAEVSLGSPAEEVGLEEGDVILEARFRNEILSDPIQSEAFVFLVNQNSEEELSLQIMRGEEIFDAMLTGRRTPPEGQGKLGVSLVAIGLPPQPLFYSFIKGVQATASALLLVAMGFFEIIINIFIAPEALQGVAGPVGIIALATKTGSLGFVYLMQLMAFISINLVILNLLPFPALDGGRFLMLIIEKIKGSPLSRKIQLAVNVTGFVALLLLMALVTIRDISRLV